MSDQSALAITKTLKGALGAIHATRTAVQQAAAAGFATPPGQPPATEPPAAPASAAGAS